MSTGKTSDRKKLQQSIYIYCLVVILPIMLMFGRRGRGLVDEKSWQNLSLLISLFALMVLGSRRRARKWRFGLKTFLLFMSYAVFAVIFANWKFEDPRAGLFAYFLLATTTYFGSGFWVAWIARRGDWGAESPRKFRQPSAVAPVGPSSPFDSYQPDDDPSPLGFQFTLPDDQTIRGESWHGAIVAEFSQRSAAVRWPTEARWRRVAPDWASPHWQATLDQLTIWCNAEDVHVELSDHAKIEFE